MHFKWDSSVARDITTELNRLEEELSDCVVEVEQCAAILQQMQGGDLSEAIDRYIELAGRAKKGLVNLEEHFQKTSRGILRANEMFENTELVLRQHADSMGGGSAMPFSSVTDIRPGETPPLFYNIPGMTVYEFPGGESVGPGSPWPILQEVNQTVVIDQISLSSGIVTPIWLQDIIDTDDRR